MTLDLASRFNIDGVNFDKLITEGQIRILCALTKREHKRIEILCSTQYGKSLVVALACIILACILRKRVVIVAPSAGKAKIIMRYVIQHLGDNHIFENELEPDSKLDRLRLEGGKERLSFRNGGAIFIISANENNSKKKIESAMGEGADEVILDEACLISDEVEATIFRMIAGKGAGAVYCKIGNPFYRLPPYSHFWNSWNDPKYHRIFIDSDLATQEKRYSEEFLEEARLKPFFDILFLCEFPEEDTIDPQGYRPLVLMKDLKYGITVDILKDIIRKDISNGGLKYQLRIGCDIGGGGDYNVYVARYGAFACVLGKNRANDTMVNISELERLAEEWKDLGFSWEGVNIDDIGVGRGVSDRLLEKGYSINSVNVGTSSLDKSKYANLKAELFWKLRLWTIDNNSRLDSLSEWQQITWIRYKTSSDKQVKIEPKEDLKKRSGKSPDFAEALMLTFYERTIIGFI